MKKVKENFGRMFQAGDGPSPLEYSVIVALLVAASLTIISTTQKVSHPYVSRVPASTLR